MRSSEKPTAELGSVSPSIPLPASPIAGILNLLVGGGEWGRQGAAASWVFIFFFLFGVCGLRQKFMAEVDLLYNSCAAL